MLSNIPVEILVKILDGLDVFTLSSCKFVNRSFNNVIKSSFLLQYRIELGLAGVEPNPTSTLSLPQCLDAIRSYRRDWENLAWSCAGGWREAIGNISHNRGTFILGEVITRDGDDPQFKLRTQRFQPRSKYRRLEERTWSEDRPAVIFGGIDPSQDLLFAMPDEGDIRILSLSTFEPYPDITNHAIQIPVGQDSAVEIDICGSLFVASTHIRFTFKYEESILVYNWRTGRMLAEIFYPCDDFFLLNEEFVACYVTGRAPTDRPSHFAIFCVPRSEGPTLPAQTQAVHAPFCIFNLPHPTGGKSWYLTPQGRMNNNYRSCPPPKDPSVPFYSPGKRLLLSLWLLPSRAFWRNPDCSLVIPLRTLLNYIPSGPATYPKVFDWSMWGPAGSRLLAGVEARQMSLQFGWKVARLGPSDPSATPQGTSTEVGITVYDFNPLPFQGPPDAAEDSEVEVGEKLKRVVTSPSYCPDTVELDGVQTHLPYRVTSVPFEILGRPIDSVHYEISLGEDGMIVWTHLTLDYVVLTI